MSTPTALIGPDGKEYVLTNPDALESLREQGFHAPGERAPLSPVEEGIETFKAGAQGLVRGVTGGLSDVALAELSEGEQPKAIPGSSQFETSAQQAERLRTEQPVATLSGELAGMVASPINKVGDLVGRSIKATTALGRIGAMTAAGTSVGTLFGAGKILGDSALGDVDLTAEKLIAGAGLGALLGGAGGALGSAIEEGARAVLPSAKTLIGRTQSALEEIANDSAISATRAQQSVINRIGDDKLTAVAKVLRERGHLELTPERMAQSVAKDREALGKTLGKFLDDLDTTGGRPDHMRMLGRIDEFEARLNSLEQDAIATDLRSARKAVAKLGEEGSGFRALDDLKQTIQAKAKFSKGPTPLDDTTLGLKRGLAGIFRDELDQQIIPQLDADLGKTFTESKATYGALKDAERLAESGAGRVGGVGLRDMLAAVVGSNIHPMGFAAALGSKVLREHGSAIVARIADKLAKEPALQAMAKSFAAALPQTAPKLGPYAAVLAQEAGASPERALAAHMTYAQLDPSYAATAQLAGMTPEEPSEYQAVLTRAKDVSAIAGAAKAHDEAISEAIEGIATGKRAAPKSPVLKSQDFGSKRMRQNSTEAHKRRVEEVRLLLTDPQALVDRVSANIEGLGGVAPGVAASMTSTAQRAVAYLAKQAEVPAPAGPQAREWAPNETERHTFALKLEAVQEPMSILQRAANGTLTKPQLEAIRAVYPAFAKDLETKALERLLDKSKSIPYQSRLMLSMLASVSADGTTTPRAIAANQTAIARAGGREEQKMQTPPKTDAKSNPAKRMALPGEKRELGAENNG